MPKILDIQQLTVSFHTNNQTLNAVDNISFSLNSGETLALLGESGCGKSLTSYALMRLLPSESVYGDESAIYLSENDLLNLPESKMRDIRGRRMAMIFQEPMTALNPVLTIGEQLAEAILQHQTLKGKALRNRMLSLLEDVEIPNPEMRLLQYPHQLSGGQKQRVVIAIALANNPEVLIADEPTTALDVTIQAQILTLLKKLQRQYQMSLLFITHDLGVVKAIADRVCVMYAGQIVETASVEQFFKQPLHPYSQKMLVAVPSMARRGQQLQVIAGQVPSLDAIPVGCRFHPRCPYAFSLCDKEEPALQPINEGLVRCHLYSPAFSGISSRSTNIAAALDLEGEPRDVGVQKTTVIEVEHLAVHFKGPRQLWKRTYQINKAVDDLSFKLFKGKTLALVGESGCGKTTVSRVLLRLQTITHGSVMYRGENIASLHGQGLREFRKNVQIIFQDPFSSMNPRMTIGDILAEGMQAQGISARKIQKKQHQLLEQVNLPAASLLRYPHQFSGGQRQRICIARALATEPEVLICDEPTSALDVSVQAQILNLLKELQHEYGLAYLFITHNMGVVSYMADDVLVMRNGKAVEFASCQQIFANPQETYTQQLLSGVLEV